jgi:hypothetical protein
MKISFYRLIAFGTLLVLSALGSPAQAADSCREVFMDALTLKTESMSTDAYFSSDNKSFRPATVYQIDGEKAFVGLWSTYWGAPYVSQKAWVPLSHLHKSEGWKPVEVSRGLIERIKTKNSAKTKEVYAYVDTVLWGLWTVDGKQRKVVIESIDDHLAIVSYVWGMSMTQTVTSPKSIEILGRGYRPFN